MSQAKRQIIRGVVVVVALVWCLYEWVFLSDGPAYFAEDWRRSALVAALGIAGGLAVYGCMQLSGRVRRRLTATIFGVGAGLAVWGCVDSLWLLLELFQLREFLSMVPYVWIPAVAQFVMFSLFGGLCLWLWRRHRKRDQTQES